MFSYNKTSEAPGRCLKRYHGVGQNMVWESGHLCGFGQIIVSSSFSFSPMEREAGEGGGSYEVLSSSNGQRLSQAVVWFNKDLLNSDL